MRTDRTAQLIYLLGAIERRNGAELTNKFAIVDWLTAQLDAGHSLTRCCCAMSRSNRAAQPSISRHRNTNAHRN